MHHITFTTVYGGTRVFKFEASEISKVIELTNLLKSKGVEYKHVFWD